MHLQLPFIFGKISMPRPIRVLHLISSFAIEGPLGGVARFAVELSRALDKARVEPILGGLWDYHTPYDQPWLMRMQQEGIQAFVAADWDETSPYRSCLHALNGLIRQAEQIGPVDIIHTHGEFTDLAALRLRRPLQAEALVRTVHNEFEWAKRPRFGKLFPNLLYPLVFDAELGVSQQVVDNLNRRPLARRLGRKAQRIYNALNFERFAEHQVDKVAKLQALGLPADARVIGTVGRLAPQKGYHIFLDAAALVLAEQPNARFLLVGDGALAARLQEQAGKLGIADHVLFTGSRTDVNQLYPVMDLFVSSSLWEGLPTVLLESMAAGTPVVATDVSGNVELVESGVTGRLVQPDNAAALAGAILQTLRNPQPAQAMAALARQRVQETFSIVGISQQYVELYAKLLDIDLSRYGGT